jgi:hypothetical protein
MDGRAKRPRKQNSPSKVMNPSEQTAKGWLAHRGFGGLDWASQTHAIIIVDAQGRVIENFEIEHSALGWKKFRERLQPYGSIPFAIETSQGAAVEQLLEAGMIVYPLNPKSAQAYRERKGPRAGSRTTTWTPGVLPTPAALTASTGSPCGRRTRSLRSCACCAATKSPLSNNAVLPPAQRTRNCRFS